MRETNVAGEAYKVLSQHVNGKQAKGKVKEKPP
jgi:hypothetical protein